MTTNKFTVYAFAAMFAAVFDVHAQNVSVKWELSDKDNLAQETVSGDEDYTSLVTVKYMKGVQLQATGTMSVSGAADGYTAVEYVPAFTQFTPTTRVDKKTSGHYLKFTVTPETGHKFKPVSISFDAAKCGTDGGNVDVYMSSGSSTDKVFAQALTPARNKIQNGNSEGYTHYEYTVSDYIVDGKAFNLFLYIYNLNGTNTDSPKSMAFRNVVIEGAVDEEIFTAEHFIDEAACSAGNLFGLVKDLKNGDLVSFPEKQYGDPSDFKVVCKEGYTAAIDYSGKVATVTIMQGEKKVFGFEVRFTVTYRQPKPEAKPLNRGLVAVKTSSGMLVSWRLRADDDKNVRFNLYRNGTVLLNKTAPITAVTNYLDKAGAASSTYTLEVLDANGAVIEKQENVKAWSGNTLTIHTSTPVDLRGTGAAYTPNDCSVCDMDGDGEYEIIVKWDPSNSKDAASNGVTGSTYLDCYKMDGTMLWRIDLGQNIRSGAHTTPYLCYDFDGDGYGELICKTAPGTVDGEGNYVVMAGDNPLASYLESSGRILSGPEYLTVFDGVTGGEITTINYHTTFAQGLSFWGDTHGNRSDRYLACMAYLDGEHPSAVMCRGYYSGAFVAAYDFDGDELIQRWYHKSTSKNQGLWGEGAHSVATADVDFDGKDEIIYGSAALDDDGTLLYRTGLGHGDALHVGDFVPERDGLEVFMAHEEKPYGCDLRDARTGELLVHFTAGGDTGRGLIADFDDAHEGSEFATSAASDLYDCHGNSIGNWNNGSSSSASLNFRIYWDGDLYDEYMDRIHIDKWNSSSKSFGRLNTLYNYGVSSINSTKNNPNLQADILGDWREEVIYFNASDNSLVLIATDLTSDYKMPTLMDDRQYAEAVVWQNVGYNQPPHVSFDPIKRFTITRKMEKGWDSFFTTYPVAVPDGCTVYTVNGYANDGDSIRIKKVTSKVIPANTGVLVRSDKESLDFVPTIKTGSISGTNLLSGACVDSVLISSVADNTGLYIFDVDGEHGAGFYRAEGDVCIANAAFLRVKGSAENPAKDYYIIGMSMNPTAIEGVSADDVSLSDADIYTLHGLKVNRIDRSGVYIVNGRKMYVRK